MLKIFFIISIFSFSSYSFALSKMAHQVVCQLAFEHLSPFKQQQVVYLLSNIASPDKKIINKYNHHNSNKAISFSDACTWADAIKNSGEYAKYKTWHYMNVARNIYLDGTNVKLLGINMKNCAYRPLVGNGLSRDTSVYVGVQTLENSGVDRRVDLILTEAGMEWQMPEAHAYWS